MTGRLVREPATWAVLVLLASAVFCAVDRNWLAAVLAATAAWWAGCTALLMADSAFEEEL